MTNQWQIPKMTVHKITVDQSKVLKNRLFRFGGPPGITCNSIMDGMELFN